MCASLKGLLVAFNIHLMYYDMNPRIEQHAMRTHRHRGAAFSWLHVPLTGAVLSLGAGMTEVRRAYDRSRRGAGAERGTVRTREAA